MTSTDNYYGLVDGVQFSLTNTYYGISTGPSKPQNVGNGSVYIEMDTGTIYFYDAENSRWLKWGASE